LIARSLGGAHDGMRCVTKPGSSGTDDALLVARRCCLPPMIAFRTGSRS